MRALALTLPLLLSVVRLQGADALSTWHLRHIVEQDASFFRPETIAYGNGVFVAPAKHNTVLRSSDGVDWVRYLSFGTFRNESWFFLNGLFFNIFSVSSDGLVWTNASIPLRFAYNGERYVSAQLSTSTNGLNWSDAQNPFGELFDIAYGAGVFALVGRENSRDSVILTSPDGLTWTFRREQKNEYLPSILFGNGRFVAWGFANGTNLVSTDGITWDYVPGPRPRKFLNSLFVSFPSPTNFATSLDAVSWTTNSFGTNTSAYMLDITFGNGTFVTVLLNPLTSNSEIWQSDPVTNSPPAAPALAVAPYPGLTITGTAGARYRIEYRDALAANGAWNVLTNVVLPSSPWLYFDREAFAHPRRFYRAAAE